MQIKSIYFSIFIASLLLNFGEFDESVYNYKEKIGYIGPTCAVVGDDLYIHGAYVRRLNGLEIEHFNSYQQKLGQFYDEVTTENENSTSPKPKKMYPSTLTFCNGLDDSVEVVLAGCTVRNNRVYIEDRLIRPLNALEREKINHVMATRIQTTLLYRKKRFTDNHEPSIISQVPQISHNDVTDLIKQILNVNSSIAERFLPVVKMSPILSEVAEQAENSGNISQDSPNEYGEEEKTEKRKSAKRSQNSLESLTISKPPNMVPNDATIDDINDPIIQKLIQSLTSGQHNGELAKQELTQKVGQHPPFYVLPPGIGSSLKPGDKTIIGGQTYVAVPLNMAFPNGLPGGNLNPPSNNVGSNQNLQPESFPSPFNNNFHSIPTKNSNYENPVPLPSSNFPVMPPFEQNFGTLPLANTFSNGNGHNFNKNFPFLRNNFGMPNMNHYIPPSPDLPTGMYYSGPSVNTNSGSNFNSFANFPSGHESSQIPLPSTQSIQTPFNLPLNSLPLPNGNSATPSSIFIPFSNSINNNYPDTLRYHPGKKEFGLQPVRLPNEICTAHIVDPFHLKL